MPKLLGEFLKEKQEPFALEVYLVERGYSKGTRNSAQFLKRSASLPNCSGFVKALLSRLVLPNSRKFKNPGNGGRGEEDADEDNFSSASGTTLFDSCSETCCSEEDSQCRPSENGNIFSEEELTGRKLKWSNGQLSPASILRETESDEKCSPVHYKRYSLKTRPGESSTSKSQSKSSQQPQELMGLNSYAQYIINKRAMHQTKQLLIDCVRQVIDNHSKRDHKRRRQPKKILGAEEIWKLVCESVWLWSQDPIDEGNILHLLHYDFMASAEEWSANSELQKQEISMEIGDAILEDFFNEIATGLALYNFA